jgi:hypothetical protein
MAIQKENVSIDVQDIIDLLHSGYTWFKKDDLGYGSIQEKFNALDIHIKTIQKHPDLKDVDTIAKVFTITNRNKTDNGGATTLSLDNSTNEKSLGSLSTTEARVTEPVSNNGLQSIGRVSSQEGNGQVAVSELSAFADL